jgi:5'-nucleotidase
VTSLTILVDLDSILADLDAKWYSTWNKLTGDTLHKSKVTEWATHKFCLNQDMRVYDVLNEDGFFRDLKPIAGGIDACRVLTKDGHRIIIVTAVPEESRTAEYDKRMWVREHLPFINKKDFVSTHAKDSIRGDVLVDDGPHNIKAFRENNLTSMIATFDYLYNKEAQKLCDFVATGHHETGESWAQTLLAIRQYARYKGAK